MIIITPQIKISRQRTRLGGAFVCFMTMLIGLSNAYAGIIWSGPQDIVKGFYQSLSVNINDQGPLSDATSDITFNLTDLGGFLAELRVSASGTSGYAYSINNAVILDLNDSIPGALDLNSSTSFRTLLAGAGDSHKFVAVQFNIGPNIHYGWIEFSFVAWGSSRLLDSNFTIHSWAYEASPDVPILAGERPAIIDETTDSPSLIQPLAGVLSASPLLFSLTLPEAALSGSITLDFVSLVQTSQWVLVDALGGTTSSFSYDIASDASLLPEVSSVSTVGLAPALYTVTLSYQDALGNPVASDVHNGVRVGLPEIRIISFDVGALVFIQSLDGEGNGPTIPQYRNSITSSWVDASTYTNTVSEGVTESVFPKPASLDEAGFFRLRRAE